MFRRNVLVMLLLGLVIGLQQDVFASGRKKKGGKKTSSSSAALQPPIGRVSRHISSEQHDRVMQAVVQEYLLANMDTLAPGKKALLTKFTKATGVGKDRLSGFIRVVRSARHQVSANPSSSLPEKLIQEFTDITTVGQLLAKLAELVETSQAILDHKTWVIFQDIAPAIELLMPQLVALQGQLNTAIAVGSITAESGVQVYAELNNAPQATVSVVSVEHATAASRVLNGLYERRGMLVAAGLTGVCFIVAGVYLPILLPTMQAGAQIGAGIGAGASLVVSFCKRDGVKASVEKALRNAVFGAWAGTAAPLVAHVVPTASFAGFGMVAPVIEATVENAMLGFITGGLHGIDNGIDNSEILRRAIVGAGFGAIFGATLEGTRMVYAEFMRMRAFSEELQTQINAVRDAAGQDSLTADQIAELRASGGHLFAQNQECAAGLERLNARVSELQLDLNSVHAESANQTHLIQELQRNLTAANQEIAKMKMSEISRKFSLDAAAQNVTRAEAALAERVAALEAQAAAHQVVAPGFWIAAKDRVRSFLPNGWR